MRQLTRLSTTAWTGLGPQMKASMIVLRIITRISSFLECIRYLSNNRHVVKLILDRNQRYKYKKQTTCTKTHSTRIIDREYLISKMKVTIFKILKAETINSRMTQMNSRRTIFYPSMDTTKISSLIGMNKIPRTISRCKLKIVR